MAVLKAVNFEIYSTENRTFPKAFKQGCQNKVVYIVEIYSRVKE